MASLFSFLVEFLPIQAQIPAAPLSMMYESWKIKELLMITNSSDILELTQ